jgi:hypothetical protein
MPPREITAKRGPVTASLINTTTSAPGIIPKGAITVSFMNTGATDTTVAGGTLAAGQSVSFPEIFGAVYREVNYDPLSSTLLIAESR